MAQTKPAADATAPAAASNTAPTPDQVPGLVKTAPTAVGPTDPAGQARAAGDTEAAAALSGMSLQVDVVSMPSLRSDGTADQTPGYLVTGAAHDPRPAQLQVTADQIAEKAPGYAAPAQAVAANAAAAVADGAARHDKAQAAAGAAAQDAGTR